MKRQPFRKVSNVMFTFLTAGCLFLCSCGLEQFYEITPPVIISKVSEDANHPDSRICSFKTSDYENSLETSLRIDGTSLYYRIYGDRDSMRSQITAIEESNAEHTENGFNKLKSYQYQEMSNIIPSGERDKTVKLRLFSETSYTAEITYNENGSAEGNSSKVPQRYNGKTFTFTDSYKPSTVDDSDIYKVTADTTVWYVPVFAVTSGRSADLSMHYSQVLYLGCFTIQKQ